MEIVSYGYKQIQHLMWNLGAGFYTQASIFSLCVFPLICIKVPINTLNGGSRIKGRLSARGK